VVPRPGGGAGKTAADDLVAGPLPQVKDGAPAPGKGHGGLADRARQTEEGIFKDLKDPRGGATD
jgi:hypothetical protein